MNARAGTTDCREALDVGGYLDGRPGLAGPLRVVWRRRQGGRAPMEAFRALVGAGLRPAFFHSGDETAPGSRWSILALEPEAKLRIGLDDTCDPFDALRAALSTCAPLRGERPEVPFVGGWAGYFSYDIAHRIERLRTRAPVDHAFALIELAFHARVLTYEHATGAWTASHVVEDARNGQRVLAELDALLDMAQAAPMPERDSIRALHDGLRSNFSRARYEAAVARVLDYIAAGDTYQVNLSQRFEGRAAVAAEELALRLFEASPAPFSSFVPFGARAIVSSSPELFLRVRGNRVETWPIKGTRPRGATPDADERMKAELVASAKERAELVMITDLLRNDLGRVCEYGSVAVPDLRVVGSYRNVHHTYSRVVGRLRPDAGLVDLLRATLPGGSVTGAPKVRAMEIIEELEPTARGPYCGAIGWLGVDGAMDLSIAIRTMLLDGERLTFQVGGGIVADSTPAGEYDETLHKARGMLKALGVDEGAIAT